MTIINNLGAIDSIFITDDWIVYPSEELPGRRIIDKMSPYDRPDISVVSLVRGVELSTPAREAFMRSIYADFHVLNQAEIVDLKEVLEGLSNSEAFVLDSAQTVYLNSRRVIKVTGEWKKLKVRQLVCLIDMFSDSRHVQQISLEASSSTFKQFIDTYEKQVLLSITWKKS
jgi:hypothetical protein